MLASPPRGPEWRDWLLLNGVAAVVFATIPVARRLTNWVHAHGLDELPRIGVFVIVGLGSVAGGLALRRARSLSPARLLWIVGTAAAYVVASVTLCERPEEAVHFVQYGLLSAIAVRALGHRMRDASIFVAAGAVGTTYGILDEGLQWLTPRRIWDLRDIGLNTLGALLVQPALAFGVRPTWIAPRPTAGGVRRAALALAAGWLLLGGSLLLTPPRIARLAELPGVGAAAARGDVLLEYGHRIEDDPIGVFRSRLAPETLRRMDRERAAEVAEILRREGSDAGYEEFLARYNPITDPFLHELRVHLFRRDRYRETAENHPDDEAWYRSDLTVAWRENRILERWFGASLEAAGRRWPEEERRYVRSQQLPERPYESPVSDGVVTALGPGQVGIGWGIGMAGLLGLAHAAGRRARVRAPDVAPASRVA